MITVQPGCLYDKSEWQSCNAEGKMTRTLTLKSNQPSTCEATKTLTKKCKKATKAGKANPSKNVSFYSITIIN